MEEKDKTMISKNKSMTRIAFLSCSCALTSPQNCIARVTYTFKGSVMPSLRLLYKIHVKESDPLAQMRRLHTAGQFRKFARISLSSQEFSFSSGNAHETRLILLARDRHLCLVPRGQGISVILPPLLILIDFRPLHILVKPATWQRKVFVTCNESN